MSADSLYTIIGGDGKEYGPVSVSQIRKWMAGGRANLETHAKLLGEDQWKPLSDIPDFAEPEVLAPGLPESEPPQARFEPATRWQRFGGFVVDNLLQVICTIPLMLAVPDPAKLRAIFMGQPSDIPDSPAFLLAASLTGIAFLILLITQVALLWLRGQTVGKLIFRTRIVRADDESNPGFFRACVLRTFLAQGLLPMVLRFTPYTPLAFLIFDYSLVLRGDRRCLHDHIAGTKVVKASASPSGG